MEQLLNALKVLNDAKHNLDPDYIKDVTNLSTTMMKDLTRITGNFFTIFTKKKPMKRH